MEENSLSQNKNGLRTLIVDLKRQSMIDDLLFSQDKDALSLMVDETLKGIDIRKEYPTFFKTIVKNTDLRQRFLDSIRIIEANTTVGRRLVDDILNQETDFFQIKRIPSSKIIQQTIEQLQSIFFPQQNLVYRGSSDHAPHYMLLNEEIELQPVTYSILLEGTLSHEPNMFSLDFDLAISEAGEDASATLPVEMEITWGKYTQHLTLHDEGETTLADVPISAFLNVDLTQVTAAMEISLSRPQ